MAEETKKDINKTIERYNTLREKYKLPSFDFLNQNFEIEAIAEDNNIYLLRRIRKAIIEKVFYYLRTLDAFMNPSNSPIFIMNLIHSFKPEDNELIKAIYKKLGEYEIESFGLEVEYDEAKEANFINSISEDWKSIALDLKKLYETMKIGYNKEESKKNHKSYFG
jgi:hypothetical protein